MLRCISRYKSDVGSFEPGSIINDLPLEAWLKRDSAGSFEEFKPEDKPAVDHATTIGDQTEAPTEAPVADVIAPVEEAPAEQPVAGPAPEELVADPVPTPEPAIEQPEALPDTVEPPAPTKPGKKGGA